MARAVVLAVAVAVVAGGAAMPTGGAGPAYTGTPSPWGRPVYVQVDTDARIEACDGLVPVVGTRPAPLTGCRPVQSCRPCEPGRAAPGQVFILWPSVWRYRVYRPDGTATPDATETPSATAGAPCVPRFVVVVVTATPTDTPRPTETMESTPTAVPTTGTWWPIVLQRR